MKKNTLYIIAVVFVTYAIVILIPTFVDSAVQQVGFIDQKVNFGGNAQPVTISSGTVSVSGSTVSVSGNFSVSGSTVSITGSTVTVNGSVGANVTNGSGSNAVNIQDGGNSITIDGTVGVSGTVGVNLKQINDAGPVDTGTGNVGSQTQRVVLPDNQPTIEVKPRTSSTITKSSNTVTTSNQQLFPANASRKGLECSSLCTNNKTVFLSLGSAAATTTDYPIEPCSSWQPPSELVWIGAVQAIAEQGSQVVRCISYE